MNKLIAFICVVFFPSAVWGSWTPVQEKYFQDNVSKEGTINLGSNFVSKFLLVDTFKGKWLKVQASTHHSAPDFEIMIHAFHADQTHGLKAQTQRIPTRCDSQGSIKTCFSYNYFDENTESIRIAFWSWNQPVEISHPILEVADNVAPSSSNLRRLEKLTLEIKRLYYQSAKVDWEKASAEAKKVIGSPSDIDPLPVAANKILTQLPEISHMSVSVLKDDGASSAHISDSEMPSCKPLKLNDIFLLRMPGTPQNISDYPRYMNSAQSCLLNHSPRKWIIDLTRNSGGDSNLMLAGLAGLFSNESLMSFVSNDHIVSTVKIFDKKIKNGSHLLYKWNQKIPHFQGETIFVIDSRCASACEALAIIGKNKFRVFGQPSAGLTTANEIIRLNENDILSVTSANMADKKGKTYSRITPDIVLTDEQLSKFLRTGDLND